MSASARRKSAIDADFVRRFEENHGVLRHHFSVLMMEHLIDCLRAFGDLEEMLVMEVVKDTFLRAHLDAAIGVRPHHQELDDSVTASMIAAKTGIPRQTVRRKLFSLERRGWVTQTAAAWRLSMSPEKATARADLASLDRRGLERLARLISAIEPFARELERLRSNEGKQLSVE